MRIATAAVMHESNTFTSIRTNFKDFYTASGEDVYSVERWRGTVIDGVHDTLRKAGAQIVPLFFARALPSGQVKAEAFAQMKDRILQGIKNAGELDGFCCILHGSMAVEGIDDPEGELLKEIRQLLPGVPISCPLDMHATLTRDMVQNANAFFAYRTAPHIDEFETGVRAAELLLQSAQSQKTMVTALVKIPFLISGEQSETRAEPARSLFASLKEFDNKPGILASSYVMGFPWADSVHAGAGALVCGFAEDLPKLQEAACTMAKNFWHKRFEFEFTTTAMAVENAIDFAKGNCDSLVLISDAGDNPTAGATQNRSYMLKKMTESGDCNALFAVLADEHVYNRCMQNQHGELFELEFAVEQWQTAARFVRSFTWRDLNFCIVDISGITVIISDKRCEVYNPEMLKAGGLNLGEYGFAVLKSGYLSPEYLAQSKHAVLALSPGDTALLLEHLPYVKTPRPIFPLDKDMEFSPLNEN